MTFCFLRAVHYFTVHNITWRALPLDFGNWNSVWKRFSRLSNSGVFEAFFEALAGLSETAGIIQMFDSNRGPGSCLGSGLQRGQQNEALGRSKGGFSCKIHIKCDLEGLPLALT